MNSDNKYYKFESINFVIIWEDGINTLHGAAETVFE